MDVALPLLVNIFIPSASLVLLVAGFSLVYSVSRVMHIAHGAVAILAGYLFWFGYSVRGLPFAVAAFASLAIAVVVGLGLNEIVYERLRSRRNVSGAGLMIATLSVLIIIENLTLGLFGSSTKSFPDLKGAVHAFGSAVVTDAQLYSMILTAFLMGGLIACIRWTKTGKALRAVADHEGAAEIVGISSLNMRRLAMGIASAFGAIGGMLFAVEYNLEPTMATTVAVRIFTVALVGGIGSFGGAIAGTLVMSAVFVLTGWFWQLGWTTFVEFSVLFLVLLLRPKGLLAVSRRDV